VPRDVWVRPAVEHAELLSGGIPNGESSRHLDDAPRCRKNVVRSSSSRAGGAPAAGRSHICDRFLTGFQTFATEVISPI
jgi:hypothetical protein